MAESKNYDEGKMGRELGKFTAKARAILANPSKTLEILDKAAKKADKAQGPLAGVWHDLQLMFRLVRDYAKGEYRVIPFGSVAAILGGLLYLLMPFDVMPDFIIGLGFGDDAFVIGLVLRQVRTDLHKYKAWVEENSVEESNQLPL